MPPERNGLILCGVAPTWLGENTQYQKEVNALKKLQIRKLETIKTTAALYGACHPS